MKRLEDIEKLSMLDLDRIASDESIKVPSSLKHDIAVTARALEMSSREEEVQADSKPHRKDPKDDIIPRSSCGYRNYRHAHFIPGFDHHSQGYF